jgi:hypothetical protein
MPQLGSAFSTSSKLCFEARYQKECWYSIPVLNSFCALELHEVSNLTLPSCFASDFANAAGASEIAAIAAAATANDVLSIVLSSAARRPGEYSSRATMAARDIRIS